jgi:SPP1 family predicted phage head-tail adaptor
MSGVAAGKLRHLVRLQAPGTTQDPVTGEMVENWTNGAQFWADYAPSSAREFMAAGAEQSEVRGRFTCRFRTDVDATKRILHRGKWFAILGVMEDAESGLEHLTIMVAEGVRLDR